VNHLFPVANASRAALGTQTSLRNEGNRNAGWLYSPPTNPELVPALSPLDVLSPVNAGRSYYVCDDGIAGVMSGYEAYALRKNCRILTGMHGHSTQQGRSRIPTKTLFLGDDPPPDPAPAPDPAPNPVIQQVPVYYPVQVPGPAPAAPAPAPVTTIVNEIPPAYLVGGAIGAVAIGFLLAKF
jgi:hypothetical protein